VLGFLIAAGIACNLIGPAPDPTQAVTAAATELATFAPIVTRTSPATLPATATPGCAADPSSHVVNYDVNATVDNDAHTATVLLKTIYRNETGKTQQQLVFDIESNRKAGVFSLNRFEVTSPPANLKSYSLDGPRLEVNFNNPLTVHCTVTITLGFIIKPSQITQSYLGNTGYFGYSERQFNLAEWLPKVAPWLNGEWYTAKETLLGESIVSELGDFTAKVTVEGKNKDKLEAVGPGEVQRISDDTWTFKLVGARSLTVSICQSVSKLTAKSTSGVNLEFYYFLPNQALKTQEANPPGAPQYALDTARQAIDLYTKIYGDAPFKRLVLVEADFPDGMEFSGLVFVSQYWFSVYHGQPDTWLTVITAHEVSHQWWYSLVGNDQGNEPFLDEGLAVYSEAIYIETYYPNLLPWWWNFRVKSYSPQGYVDSKVYDFQNLRMYLNAVYLRGALMLQDIRMAIGDKAFFQWMRDYRTARAGKISTSVDLWEAMTPEDYIKTGPVRGKYLHVPDPLHRIPATSAPTGVATQPCCG
jgi:hypothetical protein